jgi:hypothetical protein
MTLKAYRDPDLRWYVDDPANGFSKAQNELVAGVPELLESLVSPRATRVMIRVETAAFEGGLELRLLQDGGKELGVDYAVVSEANSSIWLCEVLFWYFPTAPQRLWISVQTG